MPALRTLPLLACAAAFAAAQSLDYQPAVDATLSTDGQILIATNGAQVVVPDGVFRFRNVTIPAGVTLRATGSRPMLWIVDNLVVDGTLDASGQDGTPVNVLQSGNLSFAGGAGGPAGGRGGDGSPQITFRSLSGQSGNGPGNAGGRGGSGGLCALPGSGIGSGGGGGAFATVGDPYYRELASGFSFVQQLGIGGFGGTGASGSATRSIPGGGPSGTPFVDFDDDNDFFWFGFDVARNRVVQGELTQLVGGSGGGGGGDQAASLPLFGPNFIQDTSGGGGGGGGGCLVVVASSTIVVGPTGRIRCNGGQGGGGEQAASCSTAGGGGGGSGGLLILAAGQSIDLHVKGETYANSDYDFVLAADGGVCKTGAFQAPVVPQKYAPFGTTGPVLPGAQYDALPLGGFGGLGIVQLATLPGSNADATNTVLDDNVNVYRNGLLLNGAQKQRYLAWRGWKNAQGQRVDDAGQIVNIGSNEGDIRPSPILLRL